jgi:hypothetical protein
VDPTSVIVIGTFLAISEVVSTVNMKATVFCNMIDVSEERIASYSYILRLEIVRACSSETLNTPRLSSLLACPLKKGSLEEFILRHSEIVVFRFMTLYSLVGGY